MYFLKNNILGRTVTSVSEEKKLNPRLTKPREEFINIMDNLGLAYPKKIGKFKKFSIKLERIGNSGVYKKVALYKL